MSTYQSTPGSNKTAPRPRFHGAEYMFVAIFVLGLLIPGAIGLWFYFTPNAVIATADAGKFETASASDGTTYVQTTVGTIAIGGTFSAPRGRALMIQRSIKRGEELCAAGAFDSCVPLESPWVGPMHEIPRPRWLVDFHGHGISSRKLALWLMAGFLMTFFVAIAAGVEFMDNHPEFKQMERQP